MIRFACPQCGKGFQVEDKAAGKKTKCPKCAGAITVPLAEAIQTSTPPPPSPAVARSAKAEVNEASDDVYALASEPPRSVNPNRDDLPGTVGRPSSVDSIVIHDRFNPQRGRAKRRGPSMALIGICAILLIGITVGVTLWATGSLPSIKGFFSQEAAAKEKLKTYLDAWVFGDFGGALGGFGDKFKKEHPDIDFDYDQERENVLLRYEIGASRDDKVHVTLVYQSGAGTEIKNSETYRVSAPTAGHEKWFIKRDR
jgi:DNA-directed RNA polymerase subunit RPC12/RpoP